MLLTIAIPTFNRASFLKRCLQFIDEQLVGKNLPVEVFISDNCSTDNTREVVRQFEGKDYPLQYVVNDENRGPDYNINNCYSNAKGKYVICLGDDDILMPGSIDEILHILSKEELGVLFLPPYAFSNDPVAEAPSLNKKGVRFYRSKTAFLHHVNYFITFISGNVINMKYYNEKAVNKHQGSSLIQVAFIMPAILRAKKNGILHGNFLAGQADNSGGYNLFQVFCINFQQVLIDVIDGHGRNENLRSIINFYLLTAFLPAWIPTKRVKNSPLLSIDDEVFKKLDIVFTNNLIYSQLVKRLLKKESKYLRYVLKGLHRLAKIRRKLFY